MEAKIYNFKTWIRTTNIYLIKGLMESILDKAGFEVINNIEHKFIPQGYTALWLLAESHLAIHTFPEANKTYIEISSCNEHKKDNFIQLLNNYISESDLKDTPQTLKDKII
jgi:S-adenosylmethionine decarboxylase